jgi:hypothetical protein
MGRSDELPGRARAEGEDPLGPDPQRVRKVGQWDGLPVMPTTLPR